MRILWIVRAYAARPHVATCEENSYLRLASTIDLIDKRHGSQMLEQTIWLWNRTFHTNVHFNEFIANALCDNMGIIIFDL